MKHKSLILAFLLAFAAPAIAQSNDCHLIVDRATEDGGHLKSTKRQPVVALNDMAFGIILQNYSGVVKLLIDWSINVNHLKHNFDKKATSTVTFIMQNGQWVKLDIKEPEPGAGAKLQSWGNFELGGMIDLTKGQADSLQQAPLKSMLLSFYGLPNDTINTLQTPDVFVKQMPCVK